MIVKRFVSFILILACFVTIFVSCGNSDIPAGTQIIENDYLDVRFFVPKTWTVDISTGFSAASDMYGRTISMTKVSPEGSFSSIDDYYKNYYVKTLKETFRDVELVESYTENLTMGGVPACKYVLKIAIGDKNYTSMQIMAGHGYYLYILTYMAENSLYESELDTIDELIEYISFQ